MKKILLLAAAALMVTSANAQLKRSEINHLSARPMVQVAKPEAQMKVAEMRTPGTPVTKAPKKAINVDNWYNRPDGAFAGCLVVEDGTYTGLLFAPYLLVKPYTDYTFKGHSVGQSDAATFDWDVQYWGYNDAGEEEQMWESFTDLGMDLTWNWGLELDDAPVFYVTEPEDFVMYQYHGYEMGGTPDAPKPVREVASTILSVPVVSMVWDATDFLVSSKSFCNGGVRNPDNYYPMTYYSGAKPHGNNDEGWWFGKNAGTNGGGFIDGIAQAFEKPTAPYKINQVVVYCTNLEVAEGAQVDMSCKVYKLDAIPAYDEEQSVALPDEPGELIAMGRATVTSETDATTGGLVFFTLYGEEDGLEYDITPTIDSPILVVVDGYNDPEMADLIDFSALICSDDHVDEGKGELAYLKYGIPDEDGNLDHYVYAGLNRFFGGDDNEMKTGLSIFLSIENPYLTYNWSAEDGEYTFPNEGGLMKQEFGDASIEFWSWEPSADDAWYVTCNDEDVPEWLDIQLEDKMENGEFTGVVMCNVTAQPLPAGMKGRKAVVRFEFDGAFLDYTFKQGEEVPDHLVGDVNGDGAVNIADINAVIDMILASRFDANGDVNGDGAVNIGDINAVIAIILK